MQVLNCLIVEDEALAARVIADYIVQMPELRLIGICEDVYAATQKLNEEKADLIFLDINLPKINGIEFLKTLKNKCHVIFTTAYNEYAVDGFELDAIDYLLKPVSLERFTKAVHKVLEYQKLLLQTPETADHIFVRSGGKMEKVLFDDIRYVESLQNYVIIHTADKKLITYTTLKNLESQLPATRFMKVQKSFIVAIDKISSMQSNHVYIGDFPISISRKLKEDIHNRILSK